MKISRKDNSVTTLLRELKCGDVFELDQVLYIKVYEADLENYCPNCGDYVCLDTDYCYGVDLKDGGLYEFGSYEEVRKVECEVIEK